ncbi:MAG: hypothetical protein NT092_06840 [Bacteroidia bacterium]|nr:hypothetical protein [Bacteroidia bacterium]
MKKNFFSVLPWLDKIHNSTIGNTVPDYREVNGHIHTPYSFSAFDKLDTVFEMAKEEQITVLGINDFYVTDGYEAFGAGCLKNNIFPLFNIEFIGLLKGEQKKGIRINDPNNPGRIYFSGKGLDYPFNPGWIRKRQLRKMIDESQSQIRAMIEKLNGLITPINPDLTLSYGDIKTNFAKNLVRERHLAKALRYLAEENYKTEEEQLQFIEALYGGKRSKTGMSNPVQLENEIRSNLLKAGGAAFVTEDENSFLPLRKIIKIITEAGGIPCYPVLLDDPSGKCTEFEADAEKLHLKLSSLGIGCIELIPGRNDLAILRKFVDFFYKEGFVILLGTEHNTPELTPLKVTARGSVPLDDSLKKISWEGACVVAAHQYLRAHQRQGYVLSDGNPSKDQRDELAKIGHMVIEYFLNKR